MLSLMGTVVLLTKQVTVNSEANKEEASIIAATRRVRNTSTNIRIKTRTRSSASIPVQRDHIIEVVHLSVRSILKSLLVLLDLTDSTLKRKLREHHIERRSRSKSKNLDRCNRPNRHLRSNNKTRVTLSPHFINFIRAALGRSSALRAHLNKRKWLSVREWTSPFHKLGHSSAIAQLADCQTLT